MLIDIDSAQPASDSRERVEEVKSEAEESRKLLDQYVQDVEYFIDAHDLLDNFIEGGPSSPIR